MPEHLPLDNGPRLSDAERARLRPGLDVHALERLLGRLPATARPMVLEALGVEPGFGALGLDKVWASVRDASWGERRAWVAPELAFQDPALQELLEQVMAPLWSVDPARREQHEWYHRVELPARQAPLLLVMPTAWQRAAPALVVRHPGTALPDRVLVDGSRVDPDHLDGALETLIAERCRVGLTPAKPVTIAVDAVERPGRLPRTWRQHLTDTLRRLHDASEHHVEGVGLGRALEFRIAY